MNDMDWLFFLLACYHGAQSQTETERINDMNTSKTNIREAIENAIKEKLSDPNISAEDIKTLAYAYSELTKNDNLRDMMQSVSGIGVAAAANTNMVSGNG